MNPSWDHDSIKTKIKSMTQSTTNVTTTNGWDAVIAMTDSGVNELIKKFGVRNFNLMVDSVEYQISTSPKDTVASIVNGQNTVTQTLQITGTPVSGVGTQIIGSTTCQFDVSQIEITKEEASQVKVTVLNPSQLQLVVTSDVTGISSTDFSSALQSYLEMDVIPFPQTMYTNFNFGAAGVVIQPTQANFITVSVGSTNQLQLMVLCMFDERTSPPLNTAQSLFQNDPEIIVPSNANALIAVSDYQIMYNLEQFIIENIGGIQDGDFSLTPTPSKLSLKTAVKIPGLPVEPMLYPLNFQVVKGGPEGGVQAEAGYSGTFSNLESMKATFHAELNPEKNEPNNTSQAIDLTCTDVSGTTPTPNTATIVLIALAVFVFFLFLAGVLFATGVLFWGAIILIIIGLILAGLTAAILYAVLSSTCNEVGKKLKNYLTDFEKTVHYRNTSFKINEIKYNEAIVSPGVYGTPQVDLSVVNSATDKASVSIGQDTSLAVSLTNNMSGPITLTPGVTTMTVEMPSYFTTEEVSLMSVSDLEGWTCYTSEKSIILALTSQGSSTWNDSLTFTIDGVRSDASRPSNGSIAILMTPTSMQNDIIVASNLRLNNPPDSFPITWEADHGDTVTITGPTSGTGYATVQNNKNTVVRLTTATDTDNVEWVLGYQLPIPSKPGKLWAVWEAQNRQGSIYSGDDVLPESGNQSKAFYKGETSQGAWIEITFQ